MSKIPLLFSGCNLEFSSLAELELHNSSPCFPSSALLDSIYARAQAQSPFPSWNQEDHGAPLFSSVSVGIGREESSSLDLFGNCDSSPSPPPASHYDWSANSLLGETKSRAEEIPPLKNLAATPGSNLVQGRQQKPIAQFGLDPSLIRGQTPIHDDSKSLGLPASREYQEVTKSMLRDVLAKVGLTEDTTRFSCYADLNSYDMAGASGNDIKPCPKKGESESEKNFSCRTNQQTTPFSFPLGISPSNLYQQDLKQAKEDKDSSRSAFLVLKPFSTLAIQPANCSDSPLRSSLSSSPAVSVEPTSSIAIRNHHEDADSEREPFSPVHQQQADRPPWQTIPTACNLPSSSSPSEENHIITSPTSSLSSARPVPSQEVNFDDGLSTR